MMIVGFIFGFLIWYLPDFLNTDFSGTATDIIICIWLKRANINTRTRNVSVQQNQEVDLKKRGMSGFSLCLLHASFLFMWRCSAKFLCYIPPHINRRWLYKPGGSYMLDGQITPQKLCLPPMAGLSSLRIAPEWSRQFMRAADPPSGRDLNPPNHSPLPMAWWYREALEVLSASQCRV